MTFQTMCALRVYLRRGDNAPRRASSGGSSGEVGDGDAVAKAS